MAYVALYRKYRPTNFESVAGQKYIVQTYSKLLDAIMFAYRKRAKKQPEARKLLVKLFNVNYAKFKTIKKETKLKLSFKFRLKIFLFKYFRFIFNFV